jgi:hypothetical protein
MDEMLLVFLVAAGVLMCSSWNLARLSLSLQGWSSTSLHEWACFVWMAGNCLYMDGKTFIVPGFSAWLSIVLIGLSAIGFSLWASGSSLPC